MTKGSTSLVQLGHQGFDSQPNNYNQLDLVINGKSTLTPAFDGKSPMVKLRMDLW